MKKEKLNIGQIWSRLFPRRNAKDALFVRVFSDKKDMLNLYNALNGTDYQDADKLQITTLEDSLFLSMKNDMSFIVSSVLNLYEHQSTVNPNMPIRGLLYFARMYEAYIETNDLNIYGRKLVGLPLPQYVVFYNGDAPQPDEVIYKLSDAFIASEGKEPALECKARVLNINYGHNAELLSSCNRLHDYAYFFEKIRQYCGQGYDKKAAIKMAIESCIEEGVLTDILLKHKSEVLGMVLRCDEKMTKKIELQEAREEGREEGRAKGLADGIDQGIDMMKIIYSSLKDSDRLDEYEKAMNDPDYREMLLKELVQK